MNLFIGLMSGTSMDAVDAVLVDFKHNPLAVIATHGEPIPTQLRRDLATLIHPSENEIHQLAVLDRQVGELFANATHALLAKAKLKPENIVAIGSHGQTIRHHPLGEYPYTLQIGDPNTIAYNTKITVVADFRRRDIAAGGQGAPLTPAFHHYAFANNNKIKTVLNIGGISNITYLNEPPLGFDTGPGNTLLDAWIQQHQGKSHDAQGEWARQGKLNQELLTLLLADPFFKLAPPKSTGIDYFNLAWLQQSLDQLNQTVNPIDVQNTLTELTAISIVNAIKNHADKTQEVLLCGGGVNNDFLVERIQSLLAPIAVTTTETYGIDPHWLEAIAFAWFAKRTFNKEPIPLMGVTNAASDQILGGVYY